MKNIFLPLHFFLFNIGIVFSQNIELSGAFGLLTEKDNITTNVNSSISYVFKNNFKIGVEGLYNGVNFNNNDVIIQYYFVNFDSGNPNKKFLINESYLSTNAGVGFGNRELMDNTNVTKFAFKLGTSWNFIPKKKSAFGIKSGFIFSDFGTCVYLNGYISVLF